MDRRRHDAAVAAAAAAIKTSLRPFKQPIFWFGFGDHKLVHGKLQPVALLLGRIIMLFMANDGTGANDLRWFMQYKNMKCFAAEVRYE